MRGWSSEHSQDEVGQELLICVDAAVLVVLLSARSGHSLYGWLFDSPSRISQISTREKDLSCILEIRAAGLAFRPHPDTGQPTQPGFGTDRI
jgi:hypothetical protein